MTKEKVDAARMIVKKVEESSMAKNVPCMTDKLDTQNRKKVTVLTPNKTAESGAESKVGTHSRKKQKVVVTEKTTTNGDVDTRIDRGDTRSRKKKKNVRSPNTTTNLSVENRIQTAGAQSRMKNTKKFATPNTTTNVHVQSSTEKIGAPSTTEKKVRKEVNATRNAASVNKNISAPRMTEKVSGHTKQNAVIITDNFANASNEIKQCSVNPGDVRFTQESIASHFKAPYEHCSLREAVEQLKAGKMSADDFPPLRVMSYRGCLWSSDNRRLWVFRMANCSEVTVKIVTNMHPRFKGVVDHPARCKKLSKSNFLPWITGSQNVLPLPTAMASVNLQCRVGEIVTLQFGGLEPVQLALAMDRSAMARRIEEKEQIPSMSKEGTIGFLTLVVKVFLLLSVLYMFS